MPEQSKSIFQSRIFWINVAAAALEGLQFATDAKLLPTGSISTSANIATIVLRRFTAGEVHVVSPREVEK